MQTSWCLENVFAGRVGFGVIFMEMLNKINAGWVAFKNPKLITEIRAIRGQTAGLGRNHEIAILSCDNNGNPKIKKIPWLKQIKIKKMLLKI